MVEHADGRRATYGNLRTVTVATGSTVVAGSIVGTTSTTLHFGLRQGDDYLDPTGELGRLTYPVRLVPVDAVARRPSGVPRVRCGTPEKPATTGANPFWRR
ncbi:MAG: M23 family metallopeptidase [Ilumatobacteraceae bacterium]